jgi:hypothetical protein
MAGEIMCRESTTAIRTSNGPARMRAVAQPTFSFALAIAFALALPTGQAAPARPAAHRVAPAHRPARAPHFRPPLCAAAQDAARLGALVGKECRGKADMPRNDHEWVVLCSNGRTFVVQRAPAHQAGATPTECSLTGMGPLPACFSQ